MRKAISWLKEFKSKLLSVARGPVGTIYLGASDIVMGRTVFGKGVQEREHALDVLEKHGFRAHFYLPAVGLADRELADACRRLSGCGFIITDRAGNLVGKVATARSTVTENAELRRREFKVVDCKNQGNGPTLGG